MIYIYNRNRLIIQYIAIRIIVNISNKYISDKYYKILIIFKCNNIVNLNTLK